MNKAMNNLPKDPVILLGVVNTELRDSYESLDDFCKSKNIDRKVLEEKLGEIKYKYDEQINQFI